MKEIYLPNLGNAKKVGIAAVHVSPGERVSADQLVVTAIIGDRQVDIPADASGTVGDIFVNKGDFIKAGSKLLSLVERTSEDPVRKGVPPPIGEQAAGHASPAGSAGAAEAERQRIESLFRYYQGRNEGEWAALPESGDVPATPRQIDQRGLAVSTGLLAAPIAGLLVGLGIVPMAVAVPVIAATGLIAPTALYLIKLALDKRSAPPDTGGFSGMDQVRPAGWFGQGSVASTIGGMMPFGPEGNQAGPVKRDPGEKLH